VPIGFSGSEKLEISEGLLLSGVTKDFGGGLSGSLAYVGTSQPKANGSYLWYSPDNATTKSQGKAGGLISLTKTF
jgi:hypothetical protein